LFDLLRAMAICAMVIGGLALVGQPAAAAPVSVFIVDSGADWAANHQANFTETFGYIVREGRTGNQDWERGIVRPNGTTYAQGQVGWTSAPDTHQFAFGFAGGAAYLEMTNAPTSSANPLTTIAVAPGAGDNAIVVRAIARNKSNNGETDARADLGDLALTVGGVSIDLAGFTSLLGDSDGTTLVITGLDLATGFSLAGDAVFDIGLTQDGSRTAYQVSVGTYVPIPAALPLFATALTGLGYAAWRKKPPA
jgi:hypothetical protein